MSRQQIEPDHVEKDERSSENVLDENQIVAKVRDSLKQEQEVSRQEANVNKVQEQLVQMWGKNYLPQLRQRMQELDLTEDSVKSMAATSPKALLAMLNPTQKQTVNVAPPNSTFRASVKYDGKNYAYFEKMRKTDPKTYWMPETQNEMSRLAFEKGKDFYN